jgi:Carboxypeptidase regulatory-like domain
VTRLDAPVRTKNAFRAAPTWARWIRAGWAAAALLCAGRPARAEGFQGTVVDQTSAPLPGVSVTLTPEGATTAIPTTTSADGSFAFPRCPPGARVTASLPGFQTATVTCSKAAQIVLEVAATTDSAEVTASRESDSPTSGGVGTHLSTATLDRLPTATGHAREALPLLPSVVRGVDGLLRIDGVRPHESPLLFDGFNVTDPATGESSIDPPIESVANVEVLRDPMAVTFGGALGSMASIETKSGGDAIDAGIQGFLPRPRLSGQGFGTLEGFSPRAHFGGRGGPLRFLVAAEFDFNRFAVPGVTTSSGGPDSRDTSATVFGRADLELSSTHVVSVEGLWSPSDQRYHGLSPLRTTAAAPTLANRDAFGGIVDRHSLGANDNLELRLGVLSHHSEEGPNGNGTAEIAPTGWSGGYFSSMARTATRLEGSASWERDLHGSSGLHRLTLQASIDRESLTGTAAERPVDIRDAAGALVRSIGFAAPAALSADNRGVGIALRDLWHAGEKLDIDAGVRSDWSSLAGSAPSARLGFRYAPGSGDATVIKGGAGEFVGVVPLSVPAFADYPGRLDQVQVQAAGDGNTPPATTVLRPLVPRLSLPRAFAANARLEQRLAPGWDALVGVELRHASRLATLDVLPSQGSLLVTSTGRSTYRSAEVAVRRTWGRGDQLLVSYTRSAGRGDVNDLSSLFARGDVEVLQPGGMARLASDAPHRLLAWGTVTLPAGFSVAPALDWHSGFPYSVFDAQRVYVGGPNSHSFPTFLSLDMVVYETLTIAHKQVRLNVQLFNATNHFNPRDVFNVEGAAQFGNFTNGVGPTLRGDIAVKW